MACGKREHPGDGNRVGSGCHWAILPAPRLIWIRPCQFPRTNSVQVGLKPSNSVVCQTSREIAFCCSSVHFAKKKTRAIKRILSSQRQKPAFENTGDSRVEQSGQHSSFMCGCGGGGVIVTHKETCIFAEKRSVLNTFSKLQTFTMTLIPPEHQVQILNEKMNGTSPIPNYETAFCLYILHLIFLLSEISPTLQTCYFLTDT